MSTKIVVLDYGSGNLRSAQRALAQVGADVTVTADKAAALTADGLVVPGVGAYAACMQGLREVQGPSIIDHRLAGGLPVLGICVGMQVLFENGVEHGVDTPGCDQWPGTIEQLQADVLPHMGWNTVEVGAGSKLFTGLESERFYFVHSYAAKEWTMPPNPPVPDPVITYSEHGERFLAAVENGPLCATQFHPEKSGDAGLNLLENWLKSIS